MATRSMRILALLTVVFMAFFMAAMGVTHGVAYDSSPPSQNQTSSNNGTNYTTSGIAAFPITDQGKINDTSINDDKTNGTSIVQISTINETHTFTHDGKTNSTAPTPVSFAQLLPPLYHSVSADDAWLYSSTSSLSPRSVGCECFNPQNECCLASSASLGQFCMPTGSTCCANTFCTAGETCCGDFCCGANTTCNLKTHGSGCCPLNTLCAGPAICYDHLSSNCTSIAPKAQCCPANLPYCRDFSSSGLGCYASNTSSTSSLLTSSATLTAAAPPNDLYSLLSLALLPSTVDVSIPSSTVTVMVTVKSNSEGTSSLAFPPFTLKDAEKSTTYVLTPAPTSTTSGATSPSNTAAVTSHSTQKWRWVGTHPFPAAGSSVSVSVVLVILAGLVHVCLAL